MTFVAIAKYYSRDPKVFAIGMFDAVILMLGGVNYGAGDD